MFRNSKPLLAILLVLFTASLVGAVAELVTRDSNQTPCPSITTAAPSECRNLRINDTTKGLLVSLAGSETGVTPAISGTVTANQGTAQTSLAVPWAFVSVPASGGTGPWQNSNLPAVNTAATFTVTGVAAQFVYVAGVCLGFFRSGGAMTAGGVTATIADGTNTFRIPVQINASETSPSGAGTACFPFHPPLRMASGATVTFTLPVGGAFAQGVISAYGFQM